MTKELTKKFINKYKLGSTLNNPYPDSMIDKYYKQLEAELNSLINSAIEAERERRDKAHKVEIANLQSMLKDQTVELGDKVIQSAIEAERNRINALPTKVLELCKKRNWSLEWTVRGVYLHLEASELIEAIRGKNGNPLSEAADVLIVLMSITEINNIKWNDVLKEADKTVSEMMTKPKYEHEHTIESIKPEGK